MMRFELGLEESGASSAATIAAGGLVSLTLYFFIRSVHAARIGSVTVSLLALLLFSEIHGSFTSPTPFRCGWRTVVLGRLAAVAAIGFAEAIG